MNIQRPKSRQTIPEHAKVVFKGLIFDVYQWEQQMYDGTKKTFEKAGRLDTVCIFPVMPDGKIILTKQEQPQYDPYIGALGGRVDRGEDILSAAKRELLEESGYEAEELILWDARQPISKVEWAVYTFIAKGLKKVTEMDLDGGEKIEFLSLTLDELSDMATSGDSNFSEKEIAEKFFEAKIDSKKKKELEELFKPIENK
jgi:ADP-ribose pyrophosphatase